MIVSIVAALVYQNCDRAGPELCFRVKKLRYFYIILVFAQINTTGMSPSDALYREYVSALASS